MGLGGEDFFIIVIVVYYDVFGVVFWLFLGVDFNGSGVFVLLELVCFFFWFYIYKCMYVVYNFLFFVFGGGKFNY